MYRIRVQSHFSAAHNLRGYQGRCENLHGHNWKVEVEICSAELDRVEMVCDFKEIKQKLEKVLTPLDHSYLNKLSYFVKHNPTSERISEYIFYELKKLLPEKTFSLNSVLVWETDTSCAIFSERL
ncbi:MAG: 6-carboxytetrahydropterin synthase QueD [Candidatus Omnitrophota bacterium]